MQLFKHILTGHKDVWHGFIDIVLPSKENAATGTTIMSTFRFKSTSCKNTVLQLTENTRGNDFFSKIIL